MTENVPLKIAVATSGHTAAVRASRAEDRPACPACGGRLEVRGRAPRRLTVAHDRAVAVFEGRRRTLEAQLPMLGLMVVYTLGGMWVLTQA